MLLGAVEDECEGLDVGARGNAYGIKETALEDLVGSEFD